MASYVEELTAFLGWEVDSRDLAEFDKQTKGITDTLKSVTVAVTAAAAGVAAFVTMTNKSTAVLLGQAEAAGVSAEAVEDLGRMLSIVGLDSQSITKSFEFLNKTMGQIKSGATSAKLVEESLKGVGLRFKDIKDLAPEEQFIAVMDAAQGAEDAQLAMGAATAIFGRNAGKIAGYFRTQTKSVRELLEIQSRMNLQTEEGRGGALRFFGALDLLEAASQSLRESLAGLIGGGVAPLMEQWVEWIAANQELIKTEVKIWADRITAALKWLFGALKWVWDQANKLVETFGGFENVMKLVGMAMAAAFTTKIILAIKSFVALTKAAALSTTLLNAAIGLTPVVIAGVVLLLGLLAEDLYEFFTGGDSLLGELGDKIADFAHENIRPFIASLLGMTPEELDLAIVKVVDSVSNFFTKTIPAIWQLGVDLFENIIKVSVEKIWPVLNQIIGFYVEVFTQVLGFLGPIANKIYDVITWPFRKGFDLANKVLSALPGGEALGKVLPGNGAALGGAALGDILPGNGAAPATAGIGASSVARGAASSIVNSTRSISGSVTQNNSFNVTQLPGESGESFSRRVKDLMGGELKRAKHNLDSGVE